jgi:drug/metabolite transporter (DMT)-like permease
VPADQAMTVMLATTVAFAVPVAALTGSFATLAFPLSEPSVLPLVLFAGVFGAAIPSIGFLTGLRLIGRLAGGILMLFEPVVGVLLAALLLDEDLQPIQLVGGAGDPGSRGDPPALGPPRAGARADGHSRRWATPPTCTV